MELIQQYFPSHFCETIKDRKAQAGDATYTDVLQSVIADYSYDKNFSDAEGKYMDAVRMW
jgi:hypothetical protein